MAQNQVEIELDARTAKKAVREWKQNAGKGGRAAVNQLTVLAEGHMKREAPEGSQWTVPSLRDSIETRPPRQTASMRRKVQPFKRTGQGWPLVRAIVGNPDTPTYDETPPPAAPLIDWAAAKLGDPSAGYAIQQSIFEDGHDTYPNPFVWKSFQTWRSEVEDVAGKAVKEAFN